jgi:hypothetical protein
MSKARELANLGNAYSDGALSNRNLIINGAMQVAQRGTSATGLDYGYNTADRMRSSYNGSVSTIYQNVDEAVLSSQSVDGSTVNVLKRTYPTNSDTGNHRLNYRIELDDTRLHLGKALTLSYYAKADVALTLDDIYFSLGGNVSTFSQAITTSWQRYSHTFTCSSTVGSSTFVDIAIGATASNFSNTSVYYTMLQLEVGDTATPFEHRSYGDELARCQRYYQRYSNNNNYEASGFTGIAYTTTRCYFTGRYDVPMRAKPTMVASNMRVDYFGGGFNQTGYGLDNSASKLSAFFFLDVSSGLTVRDPYHALADPSGSSYLAFDAEL